jgi:hypothetical protein
MLERPAEFCLKTIKEIGFHLGTVRLGPNRLNFLIKLIPRLRLIFPLAALCVADFEGNSFVRGIDPQLHAPIIEFFEDCGNCPRVPEFLQYLVYGPRRVHPPLACKTVRIVREPDSVIRVRPSRHTLDEFVPAVPILFRRFLLSLDWKDELVAYVVSAECVPIPLPGLDSDGQIVKNQRSEFS